jgi:ABC-type nickel/cobalt efflux system permease component RcnA
MSIKDYMIAFGLAIAGAIILLLALWIMSLISWGLVFAMLIGILIPIAYKAMNFWRQEECLDLEDFFSALFNQKEKNLTNSIADDSDWY